MEGDELHFRGRAKRLLRIVSDQNYPAMGRVELSDGQLTYMVNRTRAKDAARSIALGMLNALPYRWTKDAIFCLQGGQRRLKPGWRVPAPACPATVALADVRGDRRRAGGECRHLGRTGAGRASARADGWRHIFRIIELD
jgi:hypothetical protein